MKNALSKKKQFEVTKKILDLDMELFEIMWDLEKAHQVIGEITDEYFRRYDPANKDDHCKIVYEYDRNRVFADVVSDYVFSALRKVKELKSKDIEAIEALPRVKKSIESQIENIVESA